MHILVVNGGNMEALPEKIYQLHRFCHISTCFYLKLHLETDKNENNILKLNFLLYSLEEGIIPEIMKMSFFNK